MSNMFDCQNEPLPQYLTGCYENPPGGCPNCGRNRIMLCQDNKHHCEKCWWCIEDSNYGSQTYLPKRIKQEWMALDQVTINNMSEDDWEHYNSGGCLCFAHYEGECCCGAWDGIFLIKLGEKNEMS